MSDSRRPTATQAGKGRERATKTDGALEVQACNELGTILGSELAQVEEEIERVTLIIAGAVVELSSSFDQLYQLSGHGQTGNDGSAELAQAVSRAVRALQFEDIAAQSLAEARRSVSYLRDVAEEVESVQDTGELAARISKQHRTWAKMRRKPVSQKNLDTGSVDLF